MGHLEGSSAPFRAADSPGPRRQLRPPFSSSSHVHASMRSAASEKREGGRRAPTGRAKRRPKQNHQLQRSVSGSHSGISVSRGWSWWTALPDFNAMNTVWELRRRGVNDAHVSTNSSSTASSAANTLSRHRAWLCWTWSMVALLMDGEYSLMSVYPEVSASSSSDGPRQQVRHHKDLERLATPTTLSLMCESLGSRLGLPASCAVPRGVTHRYGPPMCTIVVRGEEKGRRERGQLRTLVVKLAKSEMSFDARSSFLLRSKPSTTAGRCERIPPITVLVELDIQS
ncbi:unnamed protein product [Phytophthora fragariaefolia]|uniref:Unnamed protein product n=1 Tax=Phytophthora fragariaefolia TaxID=1490495 RepID=A0A9W6YI86_9STRA|nr:unnamed protein product [Phytophthora fragariaefolia]